MFQPHDITRLLILLMGGEDIKQDIKTNKILNTTDTLGFRDSPFILMLTTSHHKGFYYQSEVMDDTVCSKSLIESQTKPDIQRLRSLFLNVINGGERGKHSHRSNSG